MQLFLFFAMLSMATYGQNTAGSCGDIDYQCKIAAYSKAIAADPADAESYYSRGVAYKSSGQTDKALDDINKYISMKPVNPVYLADGYIARGDVYRASLNYGLAITDYTTALRYNSKSQAAKLNRGLSYAGQKDYVNAIKDYNSLIEADPNYAEAYYDRGLVYMDQAKNDAALADFNKYVSMDVTNQSFFADGYLNRGIVRSRKNDLQGALADFSKAESLNPNDPKIYRARAATYKRLGKVSLANADEKRARDLEHQ
jgi:tetratricopeptide (TPR) repeat protein